MKLEKKAGGAALSRLTIVHEAGGGTPPLREFDNLPRSFSHISGAP